MGRSAVQHNQPLETPRLPCHIRAMWNEEDLPAKTAAKPPNLDPMSVEELKEYITALGEEIRRVETEIDKKDASRAAADAVFKT